MHAVSGSISLPHRVLFAFPSRYWFTIGQSEYLALRMVPHIQTRFHVPRPTRHHHYVPFRVRNITLYVRTSQSVPLNTHNLWADPRSLAATEGISIDFFPKGTEMFHFVRLATLYSCCNTYLKVGGFPIQTSPDQRIFAASPELSQAITSFIASDCQGIHHMHLIT